MAQQTTMVICQDTVLECQHCYVICRYAEASVRQNCPACGRTITNWKELTATVQEHMRPSASESPSHPARTS